MTGRHRLLPTALRRQGGLSPELETWISGLAAAEGTRSPDSGSAGPVIAELEGLLDLGPDEYVWAPRSTLMRARDWLERLSSGVED
jgi:hypothetical protein